MVVTEHPWYEVIQRDSEEYREYSAPRYVVVRHSTEGWTEDVTCYKWEWVAGVVARTLNSFNGQEIRK